MDWNIRDPQPGIQLEDISRLSIRARALLARKNATNFVQENAVRLLGPLQMMEGFDYHHDAFLRLLIKPQSGDFSGVADIIHEVIAYLNCVGQYHYFARSDFASTVLGSTPATIEIDKITPLRMKYVAHRSYDAPRGETPELMWYQSFGMLSLQNFRPRDTSHPYKSDSVIDQAALWRNTFQGVQIPLADKSHCEFFLEVDHPKIINEAFDIFSRVLDVA